MRAGRLVPACCSASWDLGLFSSVPARDQDWLRLRREQADRQARLGLGVGGTRLLPDKDSGEGTEVGFLPDGFYHPG